MSKGWLTPWAIWDSDLGKWVWKSDDPKLPSWEMPNRSGLVVVVPAGLTGMRFIDHFNKILAASADYIRSNEDLSAALPISVTLTNQPDVPRTITWSFDSHAQITEFTFNIRGITAQGEDVTEIFTEADGWSGETAHAFATIIAINVTTRTGTGAGDTLDIGIGSKVGLDQNIDAAADVYKVVKSAAAGNASDYSGAANVTPEGTYNTVDLSTGGAIADGDSYTIYYKSSFITFE